MDDAELINKTAEFVKDKMSGEATGHDWWHVYRVWQTTKHIIHKESEADPTVAELGALLHDIADWKFADGDLEAGPKAARAWLESNNVSELVIAHVEDIIRDTSFKGAKVALTLKTLEAKIVFDADKLDAIGAIGIARVFAYGGAKGRSLYEPSEKPVMHESFEDYKNKGETHTINHFYEKLLLLKELMQTESGRQIAEQRHAFMEQYLEQFYAEWNGTR